MGNVSMTKVSLSHQELTLSEVWQWYQKMDSAIDHYQTEVINALLSGKEVSDIFLGMTKEEIIEDFIWQTEELERLVCLNLIASAEATIRIDYLTRVYEKKKDTICRACRALYKQKGARVSLEDEILAIWKQNYPECKLAMGHFIGVLKLRHWLAHGRYWTPKLGSSYNPKAIFKIIETLLNELPDDFSCAIKL